MVLNFGRVLAEGPAETVMRDDAVVEAYLGTGGVEDA
jgi:branched-chain amino acid transport system ATP-binding protein